MDLVADEEALRAFDGTPDAEKKLTPALRGVLVELAATGIVRYDWDLLQPLIIHLLKQVLLDYEAISKVEIGPMPPMPLGESTTEMIERLTQAVRAHNGAAPFTLQRMAELLLEPQKQYARLDKLALALEKLLMVTSTVARDPAPPPRPVLASLPPVNENPKPPAGYASSRPVASSPGTANGPHDRTQFPGSGFNLASAALGTLTAGAASQSPAMAADIDRLGDSVTPVVVPAAATAQMPKPTSAASVSAPVSQAVATALQNVNNNVEPDAGERQADAAASGHVSGSEGVQSEPDIR